MRFATTAEILSVYHFTDDLSLPLCAGLTKVNSYGSQDNSPVSSQSAVTWSVTTGDNHSHSSPAAAACHQPTASCHHSNSPHGGHIHDTRGAGGRHAATTCVFSHGGHVTSSAMDQPGYPRHWATPHNHIGVRPGQGNVEDSENSDAELQSYTMDYLPETLACLNQVMDQQLTFSLFQV